MLNILFFLKKSCFVCFVGKKFVDEIGKCMDTGVSEEWRIFELICFNVVGNVSEILK